MAYVVTIVSSTWQLVRRVTVARQTLGLESHAALDPVTRITRTKILRILVQPFASQQGDLAMHDGSGQKGGLLSPACPAPGTGPVTDVSPRVEVGGFNEVKLRREEIFRFAMRRK